LRVALPTFRPSQSRDGTPVFDSIQVSPIGREETEEVEEQDERYVEAVARSFLLGFESDVVIRLVEEEEGALVDMRSTSRWGFHDLGSNARRVVNFLTDLDAELQGLSR